MFQKNVMESRLDVLKGLKENLHCTEVRKIVMKSLSMKCVMNKIRSSSRRTIIVNSVYNYILGFMLILSSS
jgi:hypothetical protein